MRSRGQSSLTQEYADIYGSIPQRACRGSNKFDKASADAFSMFPSGRSAGIGFRPVLEEIN